MFVHLSIHRPRPGKTDAVIRSMHRFGDALAGLPGLREVHTLREEHGTILIELSTWDSREAWLDAREVMMEATPDDDLEAIEATIPEIYHLQDA